MEVLGAPPAMACQLLGVRVGTLAAAIGNNGTCNSNGTCYTMTPLQMKEYIGSPALVPLEPHHFSCIDGRHDNEIVATPAGDMGIFLSSAYLYVNRTSTPRDFSVSRMKVHPQPPTAHPTATLTPASRPFTLSALSSGPPFPLPPHRRRRSASPTARRALALAYTQ
jgi:hypothetical protein